MSNQTPYLIFDDKYLGVIPERSQIMPVSAFPTVTEKDEDYVILKIKKDKDGTVKFLVRCLVCIEKDDRFAHTCAHRCSQS